MEASKEEPVAKRLRSKIVDMEAYKEEPLAKRLRSRIINMETSKEAPLKKFKSKEVPVARRHASLVASLLQSAGYRNKDKCQQEILQALHHYLGLIPKLDKFTFNDGHCKDLICLIGTIPILYRNVRYNIPVAFWILETHAPLCYVTPTPDGIINISSNVDGNGKIYLPYLNEWDPNNSDILGLIQMCITTFGEQPPVFARPAGAVQPPPRPVYPPRAASNYPGFKNTLPRGRLEPHNDKEIIENQKTRIQQLEEQLMIFEWTARETKNKSVLVPELPDEMWLEVMSYLSTFDVLRNVARVSKKFHQLSKDPHVIRKIQVEHESWPVDKKQEYKKCFGKVLFTRSRNLRFLSFDFTKRTQGYFFEYYTRYLERFCPKLKIIKVEFKPDSRSVGPQPSFRYLYWKNLSNVQGIITKLKQNNFIEEFEMIGFKIDSDKSAFKMILETFVEKFPKLQRLCLSTELDGRQEEEWGDEYAKICQEFALAKNIKLEIRGLPEKFEFVTTKPSEKLEKFPVQKK